jgi:hypothetical protein
VLAAFVILKGTGARGSAEWFLMVFAFSGLIVTLICVETSVSLVRPFRWLRQIFYFNYLLHAPIFAKSWSHHGH